VRVHRWGGVILKSVIAVPLQFVDSGIKITFVI
jgi:hypothetical protein